jgi:hypothetical protein
VIDAVLGETAARGTAAAAEIITGETAASVTAADATTVMTHEMVRVTAVVIHVSAAMAGLTARKVGEMIVAVTVKIAAASCQI